MTNIQVTSIALKDGNGHEHITHLGTSVGQLLISRVIHMISTGDEFYVVDPNTNKAVQVHKVSAINGFHSYVQTKANGILTDNLLALPRFL